MESLVDLVTTSFQAVAGVAVVFTAGYAINAKQDAKFASSILAAARGVLLPALIFTTLSTTTMTWKIILMQWPTFVLALTTHVVSLAYALICLNWNRISSWIVESLTMNNVTSYPLLLLQAMYHLSVDDTRALYHLKWRVMDPLSKVYSRSVDYVVVNIVITYVLRAMLVALLPQLLQANVENLDTEHVDRSDLETLSDYSVEEADENTRLVGGGRKPTPASRIWTGVMSNPLVAATSVGLLIGMIKPIQRTLIGDLEYSTGGWQTLGGGLIILGGAYAAVEMIAIGASLRAGESKPDDEEVPPPLGLVLVNTLWRYVCIPAITIPIIYGFRHIPSTRFFIQDPAYSFVLVVVSISPPAPAASLNPFRAAVHFWLQYVAIITSVTLAIAVAIPGRGVSYETDFDVAGALRSALGGGIAGAAAMIIQVLSLMPMRTIMNYQYRYGGGMVSSAKKLYSDGGMKRYYAGLGAALFQAPLSRFGDTAANAGILALLSSLTWPVLIKTVVASLSSAAFRMTLTPIDTLKTTQQTQGGKAGLKLLRDRIKENGIGCLWWGALATAAATFAGNYPWFGTYNLLSEKLPIPVHLVPRLFRQAFIGFAASVVSDTVSNSLRVVKTYRQVHEKNVGYLTAAKEIIAAEGVLALFGRGLPTRLLTNGLQGLLFSVLWKLFSDILAGK